MTFYKALEKAMEIKHVNAAELSKRTGLYQSYFSKLKTGEAKDATWEKAILIVHALGMTLDEFSALANEDSEQ